MAWPLSTHTLCFQCIAKLGSFGTTLLRLLSHNALAALQKTGRRLRPLFLRQQKHVIPAYCSWQFPQESPLPFSCLATLHLLQLFSRASYSLHTSSSNNEWIALLLLFYSVCMVYVHVHVCECGHMHATAHVWRPEENLGCWALTSILFKTGLFSTACARLAGI